MKNENYYIDLISGYVTGSGELGLLITPENLKELAKKLSIPLDADVIVKLAKLQKVLQEVFDVLKEAPELNMCNYDYDQVRLLNDKMVDAYGIIDQSKFAE